MASPRFELNPQPIPRDFKWYSDRYHFTHEGHVPKDSLQASVRSATSKKVVAYSMAHETSKEGYKNTHMAIVFEERLNLTGARKFDAFVPCPAGGPFPVRKHPNVQPKMTMAAMEQCWAYHRGHKFDETTGRMAYIAPDWVEQWTSPGFEWLRAVHTEAMNASTLFEACALAGIRCRTVQDIRILRAEQENAPKRFCFKYPRDSFKTIVPREDWIGKGINVLLVTGESEWGKTKWGLAQFSNPFPVKPFKSVGALEQIMRGFVPGFHDGIVCDEANLNFMSREECIAFFDSDEPITMDVRFKSFTMDPSVPRILLSNSEPADILPAMDHAVLRRVVIHHLKEKTWIGTPGPSPPAAAAAAPVAATPATQRPTVPLRPAAPAGAATPAQPRQPVGPMPVPMRPFTPAAAAAGPDLTFVTPHGVGHVFTQPDPAQRQISADALREAFDMLQENDGDVEDRIGRVTQPETPAGTPQA